MSSRKKSPAPVTIPRRSKGSATRLREIPAALNAIVSLWRSSTVAVARKAIRKAIGRVSWTIWGTEKR